MSVLLLAPTALVAQEKFSDALNESTASIRGNFDDTATLTYYTPRWGWLIDFVYDVVDKFVFPLLIVASILTVIVGLYDIMFSSKEDIEKGMKYIIYGVLGIVVIQSAKFITSTYISIVEKVAPHNTVWPGSLTFTQMAYELYNQLVMPFVNIFMYAVIGTLFVILLIHVMRFITSSEEDVAKKAKAIMISNVVGIIVILVSKTIVEAVYGKQSEVIKSTNPTELGSIGTWVLAGADFSLVFTIINYALWFLWLAILILIIIQTYQLLTNPTSEDLMKKIKNNMIYIFIGLAIIAFAYVIVNFVIIQ